MQKSEQEVTKVFFLVKYGVKIPSVPSALKIFPITKVMPLLCSVMKKFFIMF